MIKPFKRKKPDISKAAFIAESADLIGDVRCGKNVSIWYNATVRGDIDSITIGNNSNIQDNSVLHVDPGVPLVVGPDVTIGHGVILHGCTISENCIIGMGAIILNNAKIGKNSIVGAGSLVTENKEFPDNSLIVGSPARSIKKLTPEQIEKIKLNCQHYIDAAKDAAHESQL